MWPLEQDEGGSSPNHDYDEVETLTSCSSSEVMSPRAEQDDLVELLPYLSSEPMSSPEAADYMIQLSPYSSSDQMSSPQVVDVTDTDSEDEDRGRVPPTNCVQVNILLLKSLQSYRTECFETIGYQPLRTTHANVMCEVLHVRSAEELRTTRIIRPPMSRILWPRALHSWQSELSSIMGEVEHSVNQDVSSWKDTTVSSSSSRSSVSSPDIWLLRRRRCTETMPRPTVLAEQVANRVIRFARSARNEHEEDLCCPSCGQYPIDPVTGKCGHTRCTKCINNTTHCPCGDDPPEEPLFVNILIRDLIGKTSTENNNSKDEESTPAIPGTSASSVKLCLEKRSSCGPLRLRRWFRRNNTASSARPDIKTLPMSGRARLNYAIQLLEARRHSEAAPHLALAAVSSHIDLNAARHLLAQVITIISENRDPRNLTRDLNRVVRVLTGAVPRQVTTRDMECILCCEMMAKPVTTPCGHMFCRTCLEKTLDYRKRCPLCLRSLGDFNLNETGDTVFVKGVLSSINALTVPRPMPSDELIVPIFVCTVAYPSVPCPLYIFDPRYWLMIRRVLESGSRRFGMVAMDRDKKYADYGTILEVRDCVRLEDGCSILSTIGLSRFKVIERSIRDGCEVARIHPIHDIPPDDSLVVSTMKTCASQIMLRAIVWLNQLGSNVLSDIENAFGVLPSDQDDNEEWWDSPDGPAWVWWLVGVLPLRTEIKVLILSTNCLMKRMKAVLRTLEAVQHVTLTTMAPGQCELNVFVPHTDRLFN